jgi:hypothetical protein
MEYQIELKQSEAVPTAVIRGRVTANELERWNSDPTKIRTDVFHLLQEPKG